MHLGEVVVVAKKIQGQWLQRQLGASSRQGVDRVPACQEKDPGYSYHVEADQHVHKKGDASPGDDSKEVEYLPHDASSLGTRKPGARRPFQATPAGQLSGSARPENSQARKAKITKSR